MGKEEQVEEGVTGAQVGGVGPAASLAGSGGPSPSMYRHCSLTPPVPWSWVRTALALF